MPQSVISVEKFKEFIDQKTKILTKTKLSFLPKYNFPKKLRLKFSA